MQCRSPRSAFYCLALDPKHPCSRRIELISADWFRSAAVDGRINPSLDNFTKLFQAMSIKFRCPHCDKALSVKDELAGKKRTCPGCKTVVIVPTAVPAPIANGTSNGIGNGTGATLKSKPPSPVDLEAEAAAFFS